MPEVGEPDGQGEGEDEEQQGEVGEAHPGHWVTLICLVATPPR